MRVSVVSALLLGWSASTAVARPHDPHFPQGLNKIAQRKGKLWFGTATGYPTRVEITDPGYMEVLGNHDNWGQLTSGNYMKFQFLQPERGVFNYTLADRVVEYAEEHDMLVRCHNLIWHTSLPPWVKNGNWTSETLTAVMKDHITTVVQHYGDRCYSWDVVNEALALDGTWSSSLYYEVIGPEYFYLAFQFAQEAAAAIQSKVKLYYNDWGLESINAKTNATVALVKELQKRGIQIDGIGQESHFSVGSTPSLEKQLQAKQLFIDMGLEVAITELDVKIDQAPFYTEPVMAAQAQAYYDTVASCVQAGDGCVGVTVWDYDDKYSWIPAAYHGAGAADLYNGTLQKKPAYYGAQQALLGWDCSVC